MPATAEFVGAVEGEADAGSDFNADAVFEEEEVTTGDPRGCTILCGDGGGRQEGGKEDSVAVQRGGRVVVVSFKPLGESAIWECGCEGGQSPILAPSNDNTNFGV